jgi:hypothetical protein
VRKILIVLSVLIFDVNVQATNKHKKYRRSRDQPGTSVVLKDQQSLPLSVSGENSQEQELANSKLVQTMSIAEQAQKMQEERNSAIHAAYFRAHERRLYDSYDNDECFYSGDSDPRYSWGTCFCENCKCAECIKKGEQYQERKDLDAYRYEFRRIYYRGASGLLEDRGRRLCEQHLQKDITYKVTSEVARRMQQEREAHAYDNCCKQMVSCGMGAALYAAVVYLWPMGDKMGAGKMN